MKLHLPAPAGPRVPDVLRTLAPGTAVALAVAGVAYGIGLIAPGVSPMLVAIVVGVVLANLGWLPDRLAPGIDFAAKKLLRAGIVFLGLHVVLGEVLALGAPMLLVVVAIVVGGIGGTLLLGRLLGVRPGLRLLIACGFSICGAAAVAGVAGVTDPDGEDEEDTVTAVALVVIFGTLMIAVVPLLAPVLGLDPRTAGRWAGGSIHEVAQVVAAGGLLGPAALTVAVLVKLARVLMLAPVVAVLSVQARRRAATGDRDVRGRATLPPIVPPFVLGFLVMVLLRSYAPLPEVVIAGGAALQTLLLTAAMFGLGCGVRVRRLIRVGGRPFLLAGLATVLVASIAYAGVTLVG
ncbi:YeiH family protein [Granulicoccus phenolivorans]|uniref:YeiH family protein n=1 Tax=Granulicoccus phenolivorans TaxID=266854 RepID=UPI0011AE629C|nr:putative sulfate exporter family transporter [Granulicoccus phenolivorans]